MPRRKRKINLLKIFLAAFIVFTFSRPIQVLGKEDPFLAFEFSTDEVFNEWEEKVMQGKVQYDIVPHDGVMGLRANSEQTASGLFFEVKFKLEEYPILSWEWDIEKFPRKGDEITKDNDDYAARVYVIFKSALAFRAKCIEYIWDEKKPEGTTFKSPYSKNVRFIVAQTGPGGKGWVQEKRNVYEDYIMLFEEEPKKTVKALAIMTDSDNTESSAKAFFRRLELRKGP